jgi:V/A-type H+-transporting ATPase subunit E
MTLRLRKNGRRAMSIENILNKIDEDSRAAVEAVLEKARDEAGALAGEYTRRAEELEAGLRARAEKKAAEEKRRLLVSEQLELRKAELVKKREILSELYAGARERIASLSGEEYMTILEGLVLSNSVSGAEEIVPADGQSGLLSGEFLAGLNDKYPGGGKFTVAGEEGGFGWGVVLREGRRTVDLSLETVLDQVIDRIEPEVSEILFQR